MVGQNYGFWMVLAANTLTVHIRLNSTALIIVSRSQCHLVCKVELVAFRTCLDRNPPVEREGSYRGYCYRRQASGLIKSTGTGD
jgi:hypothetical protein